MLPDKKTNAKVAEVVSTCQAYGASSIIALAGVPGTGKSYIGSIAAQKIASDPLKVRELQFHQSFTYEEFIEGMRIDSAGAVTVYPGSFLEWNDIAIQDPSHRYVVLIEELTRANVASVLGELLTYVEHRERQFLTVFSRRPVKVAKNIIILATYNPTDRTAIDVDAALLRRMRIIQFAPSTLQLQEMLKANGLANKVIAKLTKLFDGVQSKHPADYEYLMPFGHGIFSEVRAEKDLHLLWEQRIRHFLHRPLVDAHPFASTIEKLYPWTDDKYKVG